MLLRGVVLAAVLVSAPESVVSGLRSQAVSEASSIGTLSAYDVKTRVLTIKSGKGAEQFVLAEKASVHLGSRVLPEAELASHTGLRAKVRYADSDGRRLATSVMLSPAP